MVGGVGFTGFHSAIAGMARLKAAGIGFVFLAGGPYCGVDLDDCRDPKTGKLADWAADVVRRLDSYTEVSPSNCGVKVFLKGRLPAGGCNRKGPVELYDGRRYFAVTGQRLPGTPAEVRDRQAELEALHRDVFGDSCPLPAAAPADEPGGAETDERALAILAAALREPRFGKLARLWKGDISAYPSASEADLALIALLGRLVGYNPALLDRLFRRSGLMRAKWDEGRGSSTWGQLVLARVCAEPRDPLADLDDRLQAVCAADLKPEQLDWLWDGWLARGKLAVLEGDPGLGKSTLTMDLAARISRGEPLPGETPLRRDPAAVLIASAEDSASQTIRPRLEAAGAELRQVTILTGVALGGDPALERPLFLPDDLLLIEAQMQAVQAALLIVDPLMAFLGTDRRGRAIDAHKDQSVRLLLAELARVAERCAAAVVLVRHLNKLQGGNPILRGGGSIGIGGAARSVLLVGRDPGDAQGRVLAMTKCNLGPRPQSRKYRVETGDSSVGPAARLVWGDACDLASDDILKAPPQSGRPTERRDAAEEFLRTFLADGPRPQTEIEEAAAAAGHAPATLRRAKDRLGVQAFRKGGRRDGQWLWLLPDLPDLPDLPPLEDLPDFS